MVVSTPLGWGPEQINNFLTKQSGVFGLTAKRISIGKLLQSTNKKYGLAKKILLYRIVQACGAATATLGGSDFIVFSGRYAKDSQIIGSTINRRLLLKKNPFVKLMRKNLLEVIADIVKTTTFVQSISKGLVF